MSLLLKGGERMKDFIHEFTTKIYEKSAQNLILKTDKQIAVNENIIYQSLFTEIEKQLKKVAIFQQQKIFYMLPCNVHDIRCFVNIVTQH